MHVEVRNFLATFNTDVGEQSITRGNEVQVSRDDSDGANEAGDLRLTALEAEIVPRYIGSSWYHQNMNGCLGCDVMKRDRPFVFIDPF